MKKKFYSVALIAISALAITTISSCGPKSKTQTEEVSSITSDAATEQSLNGEWVSEMTIPEEGYRSAQMFLFDASNHNFTYLAEDSDGGMNMNFSGTWSANEDYIELNFKSHDQARDYRASRYEDFNKAMNKEGNTETLEIIILHDGTLTLKDENGEIETFNRTGDRDAERDAIMQDMMMVEQQELELAE